ncbi:MAG: hypothetical protein ACLS3V_07635 [Streptococcus sp.]
MALNSTSMNHLVQKDIKLKGEFINIDNKIYYFDKDNGRKVKDTSFELNGTHYIADKEGNITIQGDSRFHNQYVSDDKGNWYYYNSNGNKLIGEQTIDNVKVYFKDSESKLKDTSLRMDTFMTRIVVNLLLMLM